VQKIVPRSPHAEKNHADAGQRQCEKRNGVAFPAKYVFVTSNTGPTTIPIVNVILAAMEIRILAPIIVPSSTFQHDCDGGAVESRSPVLKP